MNERRIEEEIAGNISSGLSGCGSICQQLKNERENLRDLYFRLSPIANDLRPLFEYQIKEKTLGEIFDADIRALSKVPNNCLPEDPNFDCLPQEYEQVLNPQNAEHKEFRNRYVDEDSVYLLLQPYHKIRKLEPPALAALVLAIMLDGLIIALGTGVEILTSNKDT